MSELYFSSLLLVAGTCLAFALHAWTLARRTGGRRYLYLGGLALLEAAYCLVTHRYFRLTDSALALPWGQAICAFTPYITYLFGELTMEIADRRPKALVAFQRVNLVLTTVFAASVVIDIAFDSALALYPKLSTDLASQHRHRLWFTPFGQAYLAWVSVAFVTFATVLVSAYRSRRDLLPMVLGSVVYFAATILDFGILVGFRDAFFIQHFGFFAVVAGSWRTLANRFEESVIRLRESVLRLEQQRERLLMDESLLHQHKLDSLGILAAGVAHEINNPIHGIMGYARLLQKELSPDTTAGEFAREIAKEGARVTDIVRAMLRFGRPASNELVSADMRRIVEDALALMRGTLTTDGIRTTVSVGDDVPDVSCRAQQLGQVVLNLVTNARDSLRARSPARTEPKTITIDVSTMTKSDEPWIRLVVEDNGDGFDGDVCERIFEPFFTTKALGHGTGLGLSVSRGIVEAHGGTIRATAAPEGGARFVVEVPCEPPRRSGDGSAACS